MDLDVSEFDALARDLGRSRVSVAKQVIKVIEVGANKIKKQMASEVSGHRYLPTFPNSITYDMKVTPFSIEAVIGPDKGRPQGALGNLIYYGSSNNGPVASLMGPTEAEGKIVENLLLAAVTDIW